MARLLYNDRSGRQQVLQLDAARRQVVLGRQSDCDIIVHDTSVSRRHCVIVPEEDGFAVVDLGSANGTLVNDVRVTRRRLTDNDVIRCGIYAVRFVEGGDPLDSAQMTLRDRYRKRAEGAGRAAFERLRALNESQGARLIQLQDELARLDGERHAALERSARQETELHAAREQLHEMQAYLRHVAAALQHREAELAALRDGSQPPLPPPPAMGAAPSAMAEAELAAANQALRAEIAQLESALAAEDAFVRSSRIVPAVDRWRAVEEHQRAAREAQAQADRLRQALADAETGSGAGEGTAAHGELDGRIAELEEKLRAAERGRRDAQAKLATAEARARRAGSAPVSMSKGGLGVSRASVFGQVGAGRRTGLLSGLGGLGRTANTSGAGDTSGDVGVKPLTDRLATLGRQAELNRQSEERARRDARIGELEEQVVRLSRGRRAAHRNARLLIERLGAYRDAAAVTGLSALQLAECLDLARTVHDDLE